MVTKPPKEYENMRVKLLHENFTLGEAYKIITMHPDKIQDAYELFDPEYSEDEDIENMYLSMKRRINDLEELEVLTKEEKNELVELRRNFDSFVDEYVKDQIELMKKEYMQIIEDIES